MENWTVIQNRNQIIYLLRETGQQLEANMFHIPEVPGQNLCPETGCHG
jgi:hypothetical protein